jgi:hypothetical protein
MNPLVRGIKWAAAIELAACLFGIAVWIVAWVAL